MKYIKKEEWLANSPDLSPMDYGPNGIFKDLIFWKKPKDLDGLKRAAVKVWKNCPLLICYNIMKAGSERVKLMIANHGFQMKNI